jgi:hypothetical protein
MDMMVKAWGKFFPESFCSLGEMGRKVILAE